MARASQYLYLLVVLFAVAFLSGCDAVVTPDAEESSSPVRSPADLADVVEWPVPIHLAPIPGDRVDGDGREQIFVPLTSGERLPVYYCTAWTRVGSPSTALRRWSYRLVLQEPGSPGVRPPSDVQPLTYRLQAENGRVLRTAICAIPAGDQAAEDVLAALAFDGPVRDVTDVSGYCRDADGPCRTEQVRGVDLWGGTVEAYLKTGSVDPDAALVIRSTCDDGGGGGGGGGGDDGSGELPPANDPPPLGTSPTFPPPDGGGGGSGGGDETPPQDDDNDEPAPPGGEPPPLLAGATNSCGGPGDSPCLDCPGEEPPLPLPPSPIDGGDIPPLTCSTCPSVSNAERVSKQELQDLYESRGVPPGQERSNAFEASIRNALNNAFGPILPRFERDPRYTNPRVVPGGIELDGKMQRYRKPDGSRFGEVSDILEVKYSESTNPWNGRAQQYRNHTNILRDGYRNFGALFGSPRYFVVTMSQQTGTQSLAGYDRLNSTLVDEANAAGVEVIHFVVVKDADGNYFLFGGRVRNLDPSTGFDEGIIGQPWVPDNFGRPTLAPGVVPVPYGDTIMYRNPFSRDIFIPVDF